jgi:hypothetical protein
MIHKLRTNNCQHVENVTLIYLLIEISSRIERFID